MIIQLNSLEDSPNEVEDFLAQKKLSFSRVNTQKGNYIIANGKSEYDIREIGKLKSVMDVHFVDDTYQLVSSMWKIGKSVIPITEDCKIGADHFQLMVGPCSIESERQIEEIVAHLVKNKIGIMRGGVFKPRSSPYAFRGLGIEGLKMFYAECKKHNIKIVTEIMEPSQAELMYDYVDIFQVGARNAQNFNLLDELGKQDKAVLLKRGISGTINELLLAAEYVFSGGNERIILCERGIRSFESAYRNTLDLNAVAILKEKTHLPVIVDPSHGIGIRKHVATMALSSILAGADGLILEIHPCPEKALSDGQQSLNFIEAEKLYCQIDNVLEMAHKLT